MFNTFYTNPYIDDAHIEEKKNSSNKQIFKDHSDTKNTGQNDMVRIRKTVLIEAKQKIIYYLKARSKNILLLTPKCYNVNVLSLS